MSDWLKWPRRVLSEDGFDVTQVLNVYQFINQYPDQFYVARGHFISNIIIARGKLTILANTALENQVLAIDFAELILSGENKAKAIQKNKEVEEKEVGYTEDFSTSDGYIIPFGQKEACVMFLVTYVCISPQRMSESELGQKALGILNDLLSPDHVHL